MKSKPFPCKRYNLYRRCSFPVRLASVNANEQNMLFIVCLPRQISPVTPLPAIRLTSTSLVQYTLHSFFGFLRIGSDVSEHQRMGWREVVRTDVGGWLSHLFPPLFMFFPQTNQTIHKQCHQC